MYQAADLCRRDGGIMSIRRNIIIPAILALSSVGSIAGSIVAATAPAATTQVVVAAPASFYHG